MNRIDSAQVECQGVGLVEFERIVGLRVNVDADHVEPGLVIAHSGTTGTTEQVQ